MTLDEHADGRTVDLRVGQELEIRLTENPTTGFRWQIESSGGPAGELQPLDRQVEQHAIPIRNYCAERSFCTVRQFDGLVIAR